MINAASWGVFTLIGAGHYSGIAAYRRCIGLHATVASTPPPNTPPAPPSPKPLSRPTLVARPPGQAGIEQLLLRSNISTKTTRGERECKEVGIERTKTTTTKNSVRGDGLDGAIMRTRRVAGHFGSTSGPDEAESCSSSGELTN